MTRPLSTADVRLSKGLPGVAKVDPMREMRCPVTGAVIGVWLGGLAPSPEGAAGAAKR